MKYIKTLGLLAIAAAALMAFAGTASATTITSSEGATPTIEATSTDSELHGWFTTVSCKHSGVKGKVQGHGTSVTATGSIESLTFTECSDPVTVKKAGSLEVHGTSKTGNGTLTSSGARIEIETSVGLCVFETSGTHIGTLTGGSKPTLDIESADIPQVSENFFCGPTGEWTGSYTVTNLSSLEVH